MESNPSNESQIWSNRKRAMERDLQFIYFLLNAPVYKGQSPNLYERLREYGLQAGDMEERLLGLGPGQKEALQAFETGLMDWKARVYEFLESKI